MGEQQKVYENAMNTTKKPHRRALIVLLILAVVTGLILLWRLGNLMPEGANAPEDTIVLSPDQSVVSAMVVSGRLLQSDGTPAAGLQMELHSEIQTAATDENGFFLFAAAEEGKHVLLTKDAEGKEMQRMTFVLTSNDTEAVSAEADGDLMQLSIPKDTLVLEFDLIAGAGDEAASIIMQGVTAIMKDGSVSGDFGRKTAPEGGGILTGLGTLVSQDGTVYMMCGNAILPDGSCVSSRGEVFASVAQKEKTDLHKGYEMNDADRTLTTPNGTQVHLADRFVKLANGAKVEDRKISLPNGKVIKDAKNVIITRDGVTPLKNSETEQSADKRKADTGASSKNTTWKKILGREPEEPVRTPEPDKGKPQESQDLWKPVIQDDTGKPGDERKEQEDQEQKDQKDQEDQKRSGGGSGSGGGGGGSAKQSYLNVLDNLTGKNWTQLSTINIFKDVEKLFPGCEGEYNFRIENGISGSASFCMTIEEAATEDTVGRIPLEYRLRETEGGYVAGDKNTWLKADNEGLTAMNVTLDKSGSILYTLEWRWPRERGADADSTAKYDAEDTALGTSPNREHKINVHIRAEEVN